MGGSLAAVLIAGGYTTGVLVAPLPATAAVATHQTAIVPPAARPAWPAFGAAAVGAVGFNDLLASHGTAAAVPIASITKTITALVLLDAKPIAPGADGPLIPFTDVDLAILGQVQANGGSWAPVIPGSALTERQGLEAMLLPSANNYAISLTTWAFGSVDAYLPAANAWLRARGLTDTHVADASGLSPLSVSSTGDLIELGKLVLADPILSSIVATTHTELPAIGLVKNTNRLLGLQGVDGIKTGSTDEAGECLLFSADVTIGTKQVTVVGVVLGAPDNSTLYPAVSTLLASVQNGFHDIELTNDGQKFASYTTAWGTSTQLVATETRSVLVWSDTPITAVLTSTPMLPGAPVQNAGSIEFTVGTTTIREPLRVSTTLAAPDPFWRLLHPF